MTDENTGWVTIARFRDLNTAQMAASVLRANGLDTNLPGEYTSGLIFPYQMVSGCEIRLQVPKADAALARELLTAIHPASDEDMDASFDVEDDDDEADGSDGEDSQ